MKNEKQSAKKVEQYRFNSGSLYEYDESAGAYIHCYRSVKAKTKRQAIAAYEESQLLS